MLALQISNKRGNNTKYTIELRNTHQLGTGEVDNILSYQLSDYTIVEAGGNVDYHNGVIIIVTIVVASSLNLSVERVIDSLTAVIVGKYQDITVRVYRQDNVTVLS
jgi:lipoate-protein ligase B